MEEQMQGIHKELNKKTIVKNRSKPIYK